MKIYGVDLFYFPVPRIDVYSAEKNLGVWKDIRHWTRYPKREREKLCVNKTCQSERLSEDKKRRAENKVAVLSKVVEKLLRPTWQIDKQTWDWEKSWQSGKFWNRKDHLLWRELEAKKSRRVNNFAVEMWYKYCKYACH